MLENAFLNLYAYFLFINKQMLDKELGSLFSIRCKNDQPDAKKGLFKPVCIFFFINEKVLDEELDPLFSHHCP